MLTALNMEIRKAGIIAVQSATGTRFIWRLKSF
jgi:hypothetical protein